MKRSALIKLGLLIGLAAGSGASGQVFNVHDIQHGYFFYNGYNIMAFGQGALADSGNNIWNGFGNGTGGPGSEDSFGPNHTNDFLVPGNPGNPYAWFSLPAFADGTQLFSPTDPSATNAGNATSAGSLSPVTIPVMTYGQNNGSTGSLAADGSSRTNVALTLFSEAAIVNGSSPGAGTAANPLGVMVLSNVPPGTYELFLYGANSDGTRGAAFTVSSGTPVNGVSATINPNTTPGVLTNFVFGVNYTVFNNVTPNADSTIHISWGAVNNPNSGLGGEGDFNGLQLERSTATPAFLVNPNNATFSQGATATLLAVAEGNPGVAYQWYHGSVPGTAVAGQTNDTLTLTGATVSQAGNYYCVASNSNGQATSSVATLSITAAPDVAAESTTTTTNEVVLYAGHNHFGLSVSAFGDITQPWSFYWQSNGITSGVTTSAPAAGLRTSSFAWANTTASAIYSCVVSNAFGTTTASNILAVTVIPAPANPYASALLGLNLYAYWPMNENNLSFTYDYIGGNNGNPLPNAYFSVGQPGPTTGFGATSLAYTFYGNSAVVDVPGANLNLTGPMTMIAWVQPQYANAFKTVAGKGDSSYRIDVDGNGLGHFNDAGGLDAVGGPNLTVGAWHQIVGTYDGTNVYLYVDGVFVNSEREPVKPGNSSDFYIGGAPDHGTRFIDSSIAQVALLTNALTAAQVESLFQAAETPVFIAAEPTNFNGYVGGQATFSVTATGGNPLVYQWSGPAGPIAGATNSTLLISGLTENSSANNGPGIYYCTITNPYEITNTVEDGSVQLTVNSSQPYFVQDLPPTILAVAGSTLVIPAVEGGNPPITNQWFYSATATPSTALRNGGRIGGANSATLIITNLQMNDAGYY